jgi:hypothetical protein
VTRKFPPLKAASAAFAGLLVLSGGLAASGALPGPFAPISATGSDQTDVTTTTQAPTAPVVQTSVGTGVGSSPVETDDHETEQPEVSGTDPADNDQDQAEVDDNDQGTVSTPPAAPAPAPPAADDANDNDQGDNNSVSTPPAAPTPAPVPPTGPAHPDNHGAAVSTVAHQHDETDGNQHDETDGNHGAAVSTVAHRNTGHEDGDNNDQGSVSNPPVPAPAPPTVSSGDDQGDQDGQHHGNGLDQQQGQDN